MAAAEYGPGRLEQYNDSIVNMKTNGFWNAVFLVMGTMIGVGLLAVPIMLGLAGFGPGLGLMVVVALMMWLSGYALAERAMDLRSEHGDLTTLYAADLGGWTCWVVLPVYMLVFYAILVAYLAAAAGTLHGLFDSPVSIRQWMLVFFFVASCCMLFGHAVMLRLNGIVVIVLCIAFVALVVAASGSMRSVNLEHRNWVLAPFMLPVLCCSFGYHNVIPFICRKLEFRRKAVHLALATGLILAMVMTAVWFLVIVGSLSLGSAADGASLVGSFLNGTPATVPLAQMARSRGVNVAGLVFALLATLTSYIGVGASLTSFMRDICPRLRQQRAPFFPFLMAFGPPLTMALIKPGIFLDMVDVVGGGGVIILFGILPTAAFLKQRTNKKSIVRVLMILLLLFFLFVLLVELGNVLHLTGIKQQSLI